ncbi:MAG: excinuclease ABC subunit UvrB [Alphaproteobacteria bacterium]|nr:excinuclease ABC subunit UvrB [Alphaproteobacteria bacterium]MCL2757736.1 excinuclease ABC subunit UvrB [Alphaproteobacteria bacterium]
MKNKIFGLQSDYKPTGDQPDAIAELVDGLNAGEKNQVLLGVTGSGKTFTMANIIAETGRPALIMAHNKILAAQLYAEMKQFFPNNHVEYFVSYYDYYQPEAYVPVTDTYIDKDASINDQLDRMRHAATRAMLDFRDTIVISSVSSIYGLGSPETYSDMKFVVNAGDKIPMKSVVDELVRLQYRRNDIGFNRGEFRVRGDFLDIFPSYSQDTGIKIAFFGEDVEEIWEFDTLTGKKKRQLDRAAIYPNTHYATPMPSILQAIAEIRKDLAPRLEYFKNNMKYVEEQRLSSRTNFDIEMMQTTGTCSGIENYSRYLSGRLPGEPPPTLFEYLPKDAILFVDESHVTVPQIGAMSRGDRARKGTLSEYGFRLPSALDNRPLTFEEWNQFRPQTIFVSATPNDWEIEQSRGIVAEQVIRPTGLLDPECDVRPTTHQVDDLLNEVRKISGRVLVTTLTKKMAEQLTDYLVENDVRAKYLHSDIETLERIELLRELRMGKFDVLVGINLLREGLDIPECELVAIMDADKEGFLRSARSLIQTIGRAARNERGRVILYADKITDSMRGALDETARRRAKQTAYNAKHGIVPKSVAKAVYGEVKTQEVKTDKARKFVYNETGVMDKESLQKEIVKLAKQMRRAAEDLEFEKAGEIRDLVRRLEDDLLLLE